MSVRENGGPAFPVIAENGLGHVSDGMSLRDWFAGQALGGVIASGDFLSPEGLFTGKGDEVMARAAYMIADAMLAERLKP